MALLEVKDLCVNYGAINAVRDISFHVDKGEIVTLIGANGAGKTTTMKSIAGLLKPASGSIFFEGKNIVKDETSEIVRHGISLSPEGRHVFPRLSVLANLEMGGYIVDKSVVAKGIEHAFTLFPVLKERSKQLAGTLSGGEQQMLAIARALMSEPKILMLDEPSLGLAPILVQEVFTLIKEIRKQGTTVLLVEQNARMALSISDRGYVIETGKITATDTGENLIKSSSILEAYLGGA